MFILTELVLFPLQLVQTPQGLIGAHQPMFNVVQATGTGAAGAGGVVGGVSFPPYHQALAAAVSVGQPGVGVVTQPLGGATGQFGEEGVSV